jgi:hypothetical protein
MVEVMNHNKQITQIITSYLVAVFEESHALYKAEADQPDRWHRPDTHEMILEWENRDGLTSLLVWEQVPATAGMDYEDVKAIVRPILRRLYIEDISS